VLSAVSLTVFLSYLQEAQSSTITLCNIINHSVMLKAGNSKSLYLIFSCLVLGPWAGEDLRLTLIYIAA
jgi:hypothetical protein